MPDQPQTKDQQDQSQNIAAYGTTRAQEKEAIAPAPQAPNRDDNEKPQSLPKPKIERWQDIELKDRLMILATIGIVLIAGITGWILSRQANLMEGQLDEMKGTGEQTERLITLNSGQLTQVGRQVETTKNLVEQMKRSANAATRSARAAEASAKISEQALRGYLSVE